LRLTILLFDGFTALDVVGGYEVLANVPGIEVELAAAEVGAIAADTRRLGIVAYRKLDEITSTDILYVPGGPGVCAGLADPSLLGWIARLHATTTWTVGICNGVALLAAAGVLDGRIATTNWGWRDRVASYGVDVVHERFHQDGSVITGAGVSASIDAGLFLAGLIGGEDLARLVQLGIEYFPRPPAFARGDLAEVAGAEKELVLAFERGPAMSRLETALVPWASAIA
jgi:transcriptional regulator GlxA family with amidase domain